MKKFLIQYAVCALAVALMVPLAGAQSQPAGLQAAFAKDAGTLSFGEKNYVSRSLHYAAVTGGAFTATLWQVHSNEPMVEMLLPWLNGSLTSAWPVRHRRAAAGRGCRAHASGVAVCR